MEEHIELSKSLPAAFPDFRHAVEDIIAQGDKVVFRVTLHSTNQGVFLGVPATVSGQPFVAGNTTFKPDLKLSDVKGADYVAFIIPCMAAEEDPALLREAVPLIRSALSEGKPVAAELGSVAILAKAGVLSGEKYAYQKEYVEIDC